MVVVSVDAIFKDVDDLFHYILNSKKHIVVLPAKLGHSTYYDYVDINGSKTINYRPM